MLRDFLSREKRRERFDELILYACKTPSHVQDFTFQPQSSTPRFFL